MSKRLLFRRVAVAASLLSVALFGANCTPKLGEDPPVQQAQGFNGAGCFTETMRVAKEFMAGVAKDRELEAGWDCLSSAFDQFERDVRGQSRDSFTPQELATFFADNFMQPGPGKEKAVITPSLQGEVMKLKQIFVGGSRELVTRTEMRKTVGVFRQFKSMTVRLNPYMRVLLMDWKPSLTEESTDAEIEYFEAGNRVIQMLARELGPMIEKNHPAYALDDVAVVFQELSNFYGETWPLVEQIRTYIPVVKKIKIGLAGGSEDSILPTEWPSFVILGARGYVQFLRFHYFIQTPQQQGRQIGLSYVARTIEDTFSVFADVVSQKPGGIVTRAEVEAIATSLSVAWPAFKSSPELVAEFMKLKTVFFGGSVENWAVTDFDSARLKIYTLTEILEAFLPYADVYTTDWRLGATPSPAARARFEAAMTTLNQSLIKLGGLLETSYDIDDLARFLGVIEGLYPARNANDSLTLIVSKYFPVLRQVKQALFEDGTTVVRRDQWSTFFDLGTRAYASYLEYYYFLSEASVARPLSDYSDLTRRSLGVAADFLRTKPSHRFDRAEIASLAQTLTSAWPSFRLSPDFLLELMKVKRAIMGGDLDGLTVADLEAGEAKLPLLMDVLTRLAPYSDVYALSWNVGKDDGVRERFKSATDLLVAVAPEVGALFESTYDMDDLPKLLREYEELYPPVGGSKSLTKELLKYFPLLREAKKIFFDEKTTIIGKDRWPLLLTTSGRGYGVFLFSYYFTSDRSDRAISTWQNYSDLADQSAEFGIDLIKMKQKDFLTSSETMRLVTEAGKAGLLPDLFKPSTIQVALPVVFNRLLLPVDRRLRGDRPGALTETHVRTALNEFKLYAHTEMFLLEAFQGSERREISPKTMRNLVDRRRGLRTSSPELKAALAELDVILETPVPFVLDGQNRLLISAARPSYNLRSLEQHNLVRALVRLIHNGYAREKKRLTNYWGITAGEAQTAFKELRPMGINLGLLEPGNTSFMTSRFREANIFMPRSNGDQLLSFAESSDLVSSIMTGLKIDSLLSTGLRKQCAGNRRLTPNLRIGYDCLFRSYYNGLKTAASSMPDFIRYQRAQTPETFNQYFYDMLKGSGYIPNQQNAVKIGDITLLPPLIVYSELIYARFDLNRDGLIDSKEAQRAFPSFKSLFRELAAADLAAGRIQESELLALFTYILKYGKPPSGIWEGLTQWYPWRDNPGNWDVAASRTQLALILGYISDQVNGAPQGMVTQKQGPAPKPGSNR